MGRYQMDSQKQIWIGGKGENGPKVLQTGWAGMEETPRETTVEQTEAPGASATSFSCCELYPWCWDQKAADETNCMLQPGCLCHLPPLPPGPQPLRRPLFLSVCQEQATHAETGVPSGRGERIPGKQGIKCSMSEGLHSLGSSFALALPAFMLYAHLCVCERI